MQPKQLDFFANFIKQEIGILYAESNYFQLINRLVEVAKNLGLKDTDELFAVAQKGITGDFRTLLLDIATNKETSFFRDKRIFDCIENSIIPSVAMRTPTPSSIRIWSAATSYGQEPYSLAILYSELEKKLAIPPVQILGSDVAPTALAASEKGEFSQLQVQRGLPTRQLINHFDKLENGNWKAKGYLRERLTFRKLNLLEPFGNLGPFHIVFCRNVLIYQSVEKKMEIIKKISKVLADDGYLILGAGESLINLSDDFEMQKVDQSVVYRLKAGINSSIAA